MTPVTRCAAVLAFFALAAGAHTLEIRIDEDESKPYGARVAALVAQLQRTVPDAAIETREPPTQAALDAAQERLGFALPPDFVSLQLAVGALAIGDSALMRADEIEVAYAQMIHVWGTPEPALAEEYDAKFIEELRHGVLLYTEVGDGYGGLLYRPGPTRACGAAGVYYWTSQEGGTRRLLNPDGSCMDFRAAWRWVLEHALEDLE
jgi:hypothetical protein